MNLCAGDAGSAHYVQQFPLFRPFRDVEAISETASGSNEKVLDDQAVTTTAWGCQNKVRAALPRSRDIRRLGDSTEAASYGRRCTITT